jgi:predicted Fe-Mo cluster-binding NifX family protein
MHFGHAGQFAFFDVDAESGEIAKQEFVEAPPHRPGFLPQWLADQGIKTVLAGGMGSRARELFEGQGITVLVGLREEDPTQAVEAFLNRTLSVEDNPCDH